MKILIVSLHVRHSAQAVALAAGNLKAALPPRLRQNTLLLDLYLPQTKQQMLEQIQVEDADLIAFSLYLWNRSQIIQLARELKQSATPPFILLGGPEASADSSRLLASGAIDAVLRGEGEESFALLVQHLEQNKELAEISGICHDPQQSPAEAWSCSVEQLPSPWLDQTLKPVDGGVLWEVARGCPFACSFCYDAKGMAGVRPLPKERLAAELEHFVRQDVEQVWVLDSTFNAPPGRGRQLLQMLIEKAPQLHYHLEAKADFIDPKTIDLLSQLSCSIQLGLQTADPEVLAGLNRKIDPDRFWAGVELLAESGLTFGLDLIYGLPGDSNRGFANSFDRALHYRPNQVDIFPLAVLPGTRLYLQKNQLGIKADDQPPYLLQESDDFTSQHLHDCALLSAATDLFYNRGRAVGFLLPFCAALKISPLNLVEDFRDWFITTHGERGLLTSKDYQPAQILPLQQDFLQQRFSQAGLDCFETLVADILTYHFNHAETLLGEETLATNNDVFPQSPLQLAAGVRLVHFNNDIIGALETEEINLPRWHELVETIATRTLMIRRGRQVLCEILSEEFADLLLQAQNRDLSPQILTGDNHHELFELAQFAWQEGLLIEATI